MRHGPNVSPAQRRLAGVYGIGSCCSDCAPIGRMASRGRGGQLRHVPRERANQEIDAWHFGTTQAIRTGGGSSGTGGQSRKVARRVAGLRIGATSTTSTGTQQSATTQTTTNITWTPSQATAYALQCDQLWQALNTAVVSCSSNAGTSSASSAGQTFSASQLASFEKDYIAWEGWYTAAQNADASTLFGGPSFDGLWWNSDTIGVYVGKAAAWFNIIQAACPSATLPTLTAATPQSGLEALLAPSADLVKAVTGAAVVGAVLWFGWPLLSRLRK